MSNLNQEKKRYHPEVYEDIFPKKAKEIPVALGMALADAGLTTAAEIVARAKELAAAAEGAVDEKEKKEEGKIIHREVEVVVEGEVENKEDEAEGVNEEAEVEVSHRHESTPVCVLKVEEGPMTGWTEQLMMEYYFQLSAATFGRPVKEWVMRDRIPNLKKEDKKKKLYKKKDKYGNTAGRWFTLEQPKSGETTEVYIPSTAFDLYNWPCPGLKKF